MLFVITKLINPLDFSETDEFRENCFQQHHLFRITGTGFPWFESEGKYRRHYDDCHLQMPDPPVQIRHKKVFV